jgi:teichuronic acid biosynthesis glycosyltransferase TuaC
MSEKSSFKPRVLIVCSYNSKIISPFVKEQADSLKEKCDISLFKIIGKGYIGYLRNYPKLLATINKGNYDIIHAHYGLCGLLANLQKKIPVITTFHGSDLYYKRNRFLSLIASRLSHYSILTNDSQIKLLNLKINYSVIPCGIDLNVVKLLSKYECRKEMGYSKNDKLILFSSSFTRKIKNYSLAKEVVDLLDDDVQLIELDGYTKQQVTKLLNACDLVLITSFNETGPLIVKEALACNTPVVSTDVGDVKKLITNIENCYLTTYDPIYISNKIKLVFANDSFCDSRKMIEKYNLKNVADQILSVYKKILS